VNFYRCLYHKACIIFMLNSKLIFKMIVIVEMAGGGWRTFMLDDDTTPTTIIISDSSNDEEGRPIYMYCICYNFCTRQHICYSTHMLSSIHPSVRLSVCLSHGRIRQKRLNLGSCNFHQVAPSL